VTRQARTSPVATRIAALIEATAYKREDFKNKIQSHLTGAIVEFYKARLAKKNGQTRWVAHWKGEVKQLVEYRLVAEVLHPIRGFKGRRKAHEEAVTEMKECDRIYRTYAMTTLMKDCKLTKLKQSLDDGDTEAFWRYVEGVADSALKSAG